MLSWNKCANSNNPQHHDRKIFVTKIRNQPQWVGATIPRVDKSGIGWEKVSSTSRYTNNNPWLSTTDWMTYSTRIPHLSTTKEHKANDPTLNHHCFVFLCWWKRCGIRVEYVIQSVVESHGLLFVYLEVEETFSQPIPDLFTLGIVTPTRCEHRTIFVYSQYPQVD